MNPMHGLMASFSSSEAFVGAIRSARKEGYTRIETYMPYPVDAALELPSERSPVPAAAAIGGLLGGLGAYFMQYYASRDFPLNVGGRPLNSWPSWIPITFELTVLGAALTGFIAFLAVAGLPRLHHPVFNDPRFASASRDCFFLCIRSDDGRFARDATARFLRETGAESVEEVPS